MRKLTLTHTYHRVIALISDLHVGGRYAVFPEDFYSKECGNLSALMNPGQRQLFAYWKMFLKVCNRLKADSVFLVGDAISGFNPKSHGLYMMTTDLDEQIYAAAELLKPLVKNRKFYIWQGTSYHESREVEISRTIAEILGGTAMGSISVIVPKPSKRAINVAHVSTLATIYPETVLGRDMMMFKEAEALQKISPVDIIIRGHRHQFIYIHKNRIHYVQLPCWQAFVPYERAIRWYPRYQPDLGGAVLLIDTKDRIRIWHYLYPPVHIADVTKRI